MKKIFIVLIIVVIILLVIFINQFEIIKREDARVCKLDYTVDCTIVRSESFGIVYFTVNHVCLSTDCDGNEIDYNEIEDTDCESSRKVYFKKTSEIDSKKFDEELKKISLHYQWDPVCENIEKLFNNEN